MEPRNVGINRALACLSATRTESLNEFRRFAISSDRIYCTDLDDF